MVGNGKEDINSIKKIHGLPGKNENKQHRLQKLIRFEVLKKMRKLTNQQRDFVGRNINLVFQYYQDGLEKHDIPQRWRDDFLSNLMERFCYSGMSYNPESGFKFSTYAFGGFDFGKRETIKKIVRQPNPEKNIYKSIDNCRTVVYNNSEILWDSVSRGRDEVVASERVWDFVEQAGLSSHEKRILELYFYEEFSYLEIGMCFSCSRETVRKVLAKSLIKIKRFADLNGIEMKDFFDVLD
jgi:RNA polymerase sigma factor (sigma-70 family)